MTTILRQMDMGSLTGAHMKRGQAQTHLHKSGLGGVEKQKLSLPPLNDSLELDSCTFWGRLLHIQEAAHSKSTQGQSLPHQDWSVISHLSNDFYNGGDGMAQPVEHRTQDSRTSVIRAQDQEHKNKLWEFFRVKNVVLTRCRCCAQPPVCTVKHMNDHVRTLKIL